MIVGCGPYQFVKWEKDRRVVFRRNPRYFGLRYGAGPSLDYLVYEIIKHPNTRFQALLSGELDQLGCRRTSGFRGRTKSRSKMERSSATNTCCRNTPISAGTCAIRSFPTPGCGGL